MFFGLVLHIYAFFSLIFPLYDFSCMHFATPSPLLTFLMVPLLKIIIIFH